MYYAICYIRQSEKYYTKTAVEITSVKHLLKLQKGHSQCMLGSHKASPIVESIVMSKNPNSLQITCLYNIYTVT